MVFACRGADWKTAGSARREQTRNLLSQLQPAQAVRIDTCNRCELYSVDTTAPTPGEYPLSLSGREAITHLFRVASALESMVIGEYQILGQVKAAYLDAVKSGSVGTVLDRIFRDALSCAKRVKTTLDIGAVPPSVCRAGVELVDAHAGIANKRVFVIGSGRTGTLAVKIAMEKGARTISVCNRSPERAAHLVRDFGARIVGYAERYAAIADSDIVISATCSPHIIIEAARLALNHRTVFLDLASPNDIEPETGNLGLASLFNLDSIGEAIRGDRNERAELLAAGGAIVEEFADKTTKWLESKTGRQGGL